MRFLLAAVLTGCAWAQTPDIEQIMSRVGINQARSRGAAELGLHPEAVSSDGPRQRQDRARGASRIRGHPQNAGHEKKLVKFDGKYESKGQDHGYDKPGYQYKGMDIDGEILDRCPRK